MFKSLIKLKNVIKIKYNILKSNNNIPKQKHSYTYV